MVIEGKTRRIPAVGSPTCITGTQVDNLFQPRRELGVLAGALPSITPHYGGTGHKFCRLHRGRGWQTSLVEPTKLMPCTSVEADVGSGGTCTN